GPTSGGLRTAMHALGKGYMERGHEFLMVVPGGENRDETTEFGRRVTIKSPVLPWSGGYRVIVRTRAVRALLASFDPHALEVSDRTTLRSLGRWAARRGTPAVFIAHERADGILTSNIPRPLMGRRRAAWLANLHNRGTARRF